MNILMRLLLAGSLLVLAGAAAAAPITGSIGFTGSYTIDGLGFVAATTLTPAGVKTDGVSTGSFAGIASGTGATYKAINYDSFSPIGALWSVDGFKFDLNTLTIVTRINNALTLTGTGTLSSTDPSLDDTSGTWILTANTLGANFTFSSSNAPEPSIALLLGIGLLGLAVSSRVNRSV